jgi:hypothetical protein
MRHCVCWCAFVRRAHVAGVGAVLLALGFANRSYATVVEPDDFPAGTFVFDAYPGVTLHTDAQFGNVVISSTSIAPTGQRVFNQGQIPPYPWTDSSAGHTFIAEFASPVNAVSIIMFSSGIFEEGIGRLDAFDSHGTLLTSVTTGTIHYLQPQDVGITWPAGNIASIHAYGTLGWDIGLDRMTYTNTPAPDATVLAGVVGMTLLARRRRVV